MGEEKPYNDDSFLDGYIWGCVAGVLLTWAFFIILILMGSTWQVFTK